MKIEINLENEEWQKKQSALLAAEQSVKLEEACKKWSDTFAAEQSAKLEVYMKWPDTFAAEQSAKMDALKKTLDAFKIARDKHDVSDDPITKVLAEPPASAPSTALSSTSPVVVAQTSDVRDAVNLNSKKIAK